MTSMSDRSMSILKGTSTKALSALMVMQAMSSMAVANPSLPAREPNLKAAQIQKWMVMTRRASIEKAPQLALKPCGCSGSASSYGSTQGDGGGISSESHSL